MKSTSLTALDPALIEAVRTQLADDFAQRIFDAAPDVSGCIEFEARTSSVVVGNERLERASKMLYARRRGLQSQVWSVFRRVFDERLCRLAAAGVDKTPRSRVGMPLLSDERLYEEIAIGRFSRRLKEQSEFELWGLTTRIAAVAGADYPRDNQNPVAPEVFAQALMEAISTVETDAVVRLVIFRMFGPVLLDILPAVYEAANAAFTARGITVERADYCGRSGVAPERVQLHGYASNTAYLPQSKVSGINQ